jgi:hypothetical protein
VKTKQLASDSRGTNANARQIRASAAHTGGVRLGWMQKRYDRISTDMSAYSKSSGLSATKLWQTEAGW